jgi:hypothetical protein
VPDPIGNRNSRCGKPDWSTSEIQEKRICVVHSDAVVKEIVRVQRFVADVIATGPVEVFRAGFSHNIDYSARMETILGGRIRLDNARTLSEAPRQTGLGRRSAVGPGRFR